MDNVYFWFTVLFFVMAAMGIKIAKLKRENNSAQQRIKVLEIQNTKYCNEKLLAQAKLRMLEGKKEVVA